jgi:hypothetical protein
MAESGKSASSTQPAQRSERLAFTLDASTGEIVKIETVNSTGHHRELSKADRQDLAKEHPGAGVDALVERAFEAGIASLLGDEDSKEDERETEDEAGVRRILLEPLMERTFAARVLKREVLRRAIVQSLIHDINTPGDSESEPPKAQKSDRAAPKASA